ncbi:hypothetical protein H4R19_002719 [Coemansia spiralis]|nr:hypothetical protein H4R19_002719 [Coemansia spiralis]
MSAAFLSIAVQALLFSGTLEQSRHVAATPDVHGSIFAAPALFPDNVERTVNISLACHGGHSRWGPEGSPKLPPKATVLIEHVAGYPSLVSRSLHSALVAQGHRVCAYDRPGYAHTPQGYSPISPVTLERALSSSLRSVGEGGPFFVVGHRSGAEYARLFAALNRGSVIGMAFVYPTDMALLSLLGHTQSEPVRVATARAMSDSRLLPEPGLGRLHLNAQRALAALGTWLTSPPTISDTNISSQPETEWALSSPYLAQAQYFEMLQQPQLAQVIQKMDEPADMRRKLPIILLGVSADRIVQKDYLAAVASNLDVVIADPRGLQPLSLTSVARHISQHIALLH